MSVARHLKLAGVRRISGPLLFADAISGVGYGELVDVTGPEGEERRGQIIDVSEDVAVIQVFEGTTGLDAKHTAIRYTGEPLKLPVSVDILGRIFDGRGRPIDGGPDITAVEELDVHGKPINQYSRGHPSEFIQTGISVIDGMNTLVRGQKLPIFSLSGLPHKLVASQIVSQATVPGEAEEFTVVFAAMGVTGDEAKFYKDVLENLGALDRVAMFLNMADDPALERILTPRLALTVAEYLAFRQDFHVLVVLVDMTYYCDALREVSTAREEIPGRRGYPGYMYTDLASIYERAGRIHGKKGSITQLPILTMPEDDITHPIPDLTAYITEGQLVMERELHGKGIYPPINPLPSLSRLMDKGIGAGKTRDDHKQLSDQLYYAYAEGRVARTAAMVSGMERVTSRDKLYLGFADRFEREFIDQRPDENRDIETTLDIGWNLISMFPEPDLTRIELDTIKRYHQKYRVE